MFKTEIEIKANEHDCGTCRFQLMYFCTVFEADLRPGARWLESAPKRCPGCIEAEANARKHKKP